MYANGETVTRVRATSVTDPYSDEATELDWSTTDDVEFLGCAVWQEQSSEATQVGRDQTATVKKVAMPHGADVTPRDRLIIRGQTYEVIGEPADETHPMTGWQPGALVTARKVDG